MTALMPAPFNSSYYAGIIMVVTIAAPSSAWYRYCVLARSYWSSAPNSALWLNPTPDHADQQRFLPGHGGGWAVLGYFQNSTSAGPCQPQGAESANAAKSTFLATMSHEIRTPLNGVLGMAQAMALDRLSKAQRERLQVIGHSGEMLLAIVNDVLDLSKIEAGKLELDLADFDLAALGGAGNFRPMAEAKG